MQDAEHLDQVAAHIANGAFWNMGQNCSAISRLIVHEDIHDDLLGKLIAHSREWRQGNPLDPANRLGVLIDDEHFGKVSTAIETAKKEGATPVIGGDSPDGKGISPTIFDNVDPASSLARDEVFGPVLAVIPVRSADQALQLANDTHYGLAASVFSKSLGPALRTARDLKAGTVTVNCYGEGDITTPFGGYRQSGFGGRDNSLAAHDQFTEMKTIWIDLEDKAAEDIN